MMRNATAAAVLTGFAAVLGLGACDKAKPRHLPPDPFAAPPAADAAAAPTEGLSAGLPKRPGLPGFFLDHIGAAADPMNRPPATTPAAAPVALDGFAFDAAARLPAKGVDVVIDGRVYGTRYGHARHDVAVYFKTPALEQVGFRTTLPAGTLAPGAHTAVLRIVAADGKAFYESPAVAFTAK